MWNLKLEQNLTTFRPALLCIKLTICLSDVLFTHINTATVEKGLKIKTPPTLIKMAKPTEVFDNYWIYVNGPAHCSAKGPTLGKWLIFKHISCIDQVWETISQTVVSG